MVEKPVLTLDDVHEELGTILCRHRMVHEAKGAVSLLKVFPPSSWLFRRLLRLYDELEDLYDATDPQVRAAYRRTKDALRDVEAARARGDLVSWEQIESGEVLHFDEEGVKGGSQVRDSS